MDGLRDLRAARAAIVVGFAYLLGTAAHVTAGGELPGPAAILGAFVACVALATPALGRAIPGSRSSMWRITATMMGLQGFIHVVWTLTAGHRGEATSAAVHGTPPTSLNLAESVTGGRRGDSLHDAYLAALGDAGSTLAVPGALATDLSAHAPMMAAHLVAAGLVGLWIAYGERCLVALLRVSVRAVVRLVRALIPAMPGRVASSTCLIRARGFSPRPALLSLAYGRRGPPALLA